MTKVELYKSRSFVVTARVLSILGPIVGIARLLKTSHYEGLVCLVSLFFFVCNISSLFLTFVIYYLILNFMCNRFSSIPFECHIYCLTLEKFIFIKITIAKSCILYGKVYFSRTRPLLLFIDAISENSINRPFIMLLQRLKQCRFHLVPESKELWLLLLCEKISFNPHFIHFL